MDDCSGTTEYEHERLARHAARQLKQRQWLYWDDARFDRWQEFLAEHQFELVTCGDLANTQQCLLDEFCRVEDVRAELERRARAAAPKERWDILYNTDIPPGWQVVYDPAVSEQPFLRPCQNNTDDEQGQK